MNRLIESAIPGGNGEEYTDCMNKLIESAIPGGRDQELQIGCKDQQNLQYLERAVESLQIV
jgi:hypothetical protein